MSNLIEVLRMRNPEIDPDCHEAADEIERLRTALETIANYPHPDFPIGDLEGELDRAERIYMQMQNIAQFGLNEKRR